MQKIAWERVKQRGGKRMKEGRERIKTREKNAREGMRELG